MDKTLEDECQRLAKLSLDPTAEEWSPPVYLTKTDFIAEKRRAVEMAIRMAAQRVVDNHVGQSIDDECKGYPDDSAYNLALRHARDSILILLD